MDTHLLQERYQSRATCKTCIYITGNGYTSSSVGSNVGSTVGSLVDGCMDGLSETTPLGVILGRGEMTLSICAIEGSDVFLSVVGPDDGADDDVPFGLLQFGSLQCSSDGDVDEVLEGFTVG